MMSWGKNETPNSLETTRPLAIIAEKQSQDLLEFINKVFEPVEARFQKNGVEFDKIKNRKGKGNNSSTLD